MKEGKLKKLLKSGLAKVDVSDVLLLLGAGSGFYGLFCIYKPVAFIALGVGLIYWAIQLERGKPHG